MTPSECSSMADAYGATEWCSPSTGLDVGLLVLVAVVLIVLGVLLRWALARRSGRA